MDFLTSSHLLGMLICILSAYFLFSGSFRKKSPLGNLLLSFIVLQIATEPLIMWLASQGMNNIWVMDIYNFSEFIIFMLIFRYLYSTIDEKYVKWINWFIIAGLLFMTFNLIFIEGPFVWSRISITFTRIVYIVFSAGYFILLMSNRNGNAIAPYEKYYILFIGGIFVYYAGALFYFLMNNVAFLGKENITNILRNYNMAMFTLLRITILWIAWRTRRVQL